MPIVANEPGAMSAVPLAEEMALAVRGDAAALKRSEMVLDLIFAVAMSSLPSPSKSPAARYEGPYPTVRLTGGRNDPLPVPL